MAPPQSLPKLLLLAALAGFLGPSEVVAETVEEAGAHCPEGLWPLPPQVGALEGRRRKGCEEVLPRVTYTQVRPGQAEDVTFLYHPCAHPWLKLQLVLLAHVCVAKPSLAPDSSLTRDRPLVLTVWGIALEMAWVEPAWVAHWLKRRRRRKQRKNVWFHSDNLPGPSPLVTTPSTARLCRRGCVQAPALAFALRSWRPPGTEVTSRGPRRPSLRSAKRRGLRAVLGLQPTPSGLRIPFASTWSLKAQQPILGNPVLLTLATLCTRLHRNFRRGESIYWGPTSDSQDTVAAVLKRRLLMPARRVKRSRRRPLLPPTPDSGPDGDSSD
uniref:tumor protein p53-inducible protein 13 isoform X4 n=1 Tax=Ictidomys tridecemlineatus TaxID=43179 RepID=UPI001A9F3F29|nr:tumor protein p53-inducible protein 13 isoform X4 [Ictidomys tridecemlineatus]